MGIVACPLGEDVEVDSCLACPHLRGAYATGDEIAIRCNPLPGSMIQMGLQKQSL